MQNEITRIKQLALTNLQQLTEVEMQVLYSRACEWFEFDVEHVVTSASHLLQLLLDFDPWIGEGGVFHFLVVENIIPE